MIKTKTKKPNLFDYKQYEKKYIIFFKCENFYEYFFLICEILFDFFKQLCNKFIEKFRQLQIM